jgi:metallo-beta-lactamase family protein
MTRLSFLGATRTVTGSKFLVEHNGFRLLVDCGLFQGLKELRLRNWNPPPVDPASLDMILLTHAHLDHSGYLPVMVRRGFDGPVLATGSTADLCGIILPDSGHIQEEDARWANKKRFSKHKPALPLYTELEARHSLAQLRPVGFDRDLHLHDGIRLRFHPAGHILGASFMELRLKGRTPTSSEKVVLFSGDLGRPDQPIIRDRRPLPPCDHLLLESTYGNRDHPDEDPKDQLEAIVKETVEQGGCVLIPAFAVGRTQALLYHLRQLQIDNRLATDLPIHVDSPMAIHAIRIYMSHPEAHDLEMRAAGDRGEDPLGLRNVHLNSRVEDSKALNDLRYPAIIISASGMATGGRVLHHLAHRLGDHRTTVLFVGFQAAGTRGRALQDGAKSVKIHGREVRVRARVETLDGLSAHADRDEIVRWLAGSPGAPSETVHLVHGEPSAIDALAGTLRDQRKLNVHVPEYQEKVEI